jgi:hypothetical protein
VIQKEEMSRLKPEGLYARTFKVVEMSNNPDKLIFHPAGEDDPGYIDFHIPKELL